ncbi:MAG: hypothetical protein M3371_01395 [Acidobacteriota bacterium]|nr:hypothetical protein [Acidobacteriota bacterium]
MPCPPVTPTEETPVPAVAAQLKTLPSSLPVRLTVKGAASCATVVIGLAGALIVGGLLLTIPHALAGDALLRGTGAPDAKSA